MTIPKLGDTAPHPNDMVDLYNGKWYHCYPFSHYRIIAGGFGVHVWDFSDFHVGKLVSTFDSIEKWLGVS